MPFQIRCPFCAALLQLENAPTKKSRLTCPKCNTLFPVERQAGPADDGQEIEPPPTIALEDIDVELVDSADTVIEQPPAQPTPLQVSEEGMPTDPPPERPISGAVVLSGILAAGAAAIVVGGLLGGLLDTLGVRQDIVLILAVVCAVGAFGGHFAASLADERKSAHFFSAAVLCALYSVSASLLALRKREYALRLGETPGNSWDLGLTPVALFVSFIIGGFSERILTWFSQAFGKRPRWYYLTSDGKRIGVQGPWRHSILAIVWRVIAVGFLLTSWTPFLFQPNIADKFLGHVGFLFLAWVCVLLARKRYAQDARDALEKDDRPPVIYLRSFRHDGRRVREGLLYELTFGVFLILTAETAEQQLARIMRKFGPFAAIGKPGEELPEMGAARMYVEDDDWQAVVADLLSQPNAVALLQAGETQGLRWELHRIAAVLLPEQVLLFVPFGLWDLPEGREELYSEFRAWAQKCLGTKLPRKIGHSCFIYFSADPAWRAYTLKQGDDVPENHPLAKLLKALQKNRSLWPRRGITIKSTIWWVLGAILLVLLLLLACFWLSR